MDSAAHSKSSSHHGDGFVGVIYGDVGTTSFRCSVVEAVERHEFVQVAHETCGEVLGRVDEIERKTDLSLDRAPLLGDGGPVDVEERVSAQGSVIGYRDDRVILDPHGEYSSLKEKGKHTDGSPRFHVEPRAYADIIQVFSPDTKINPGSRPLKFTLSNLDARDILSLTGSAKVRTHLTALRKALDLLRQATKDYTIRDIIRVLEREEDPQNASLIDELEYLSEVEIFAKEGTRIDELVIKSKTTIINLKGVPPDIQELVVNRLATAMFELRKVGRIPPMILVVEESHNFCPQVGQAASSKVFRTLASEGRKFGLGLVVITQRAAKVDKNVLSQCNTQIILKVTNPNDLKAIIASVEGLTTAMAEEISRLPIGVAIMTGGGLQMPLMVEVRPRETRHGGESVKVIED